MRIRWYRVERDVPWVPQTLFSSWEWDGDEVEDRSLRNTGTTFQGEDVTSFPRWDNGNPPALPLRQVPCGTPAQWLGDLLVDRDPPLPVNDTGVPSCCAVPFPAGQPALATVTQGQRLTVGADPLAAVLTAEGMGLKFQTERALVTRLRFALYTNDLTPTVNTRLTDFQEASFPGYVRAAPRWGSPYPDPRGFLKITSGAISWTRTAGPGTQTVYGWYAVDPLRERVVWARRFDVPVVVNAPGAVAALAPLSWWLGPMALGAVALGAQAGGLGLSGDQLGELFAVTGQNGGFGLSGLQAGAVLRAGVQGGGPGLSGEQAAALLRVGVQGGGGGLGGSQAASLARLAAQAGGGGLGGTQTGAVLRAGAQAGGLGLAGDQLGAVTAGGFQIGFDFRNTSGYVTDPTDCVFQGGETYPATYTPAAGGSFTAGWNFDESSGTRNRDNTLDPRLAGLLFDTSLTRFFRLDLPSAGNYEVRLAMGDGVYASGAYWQLYDGVTLLATFSGATSGGHFLDANGTDRTAAAWPGSNTPVTFTFAGTQLILKMFSTGAQVSAIAHLHCKKV